MTYCSLETLAPVTLTEPFAGSLFSEPERDSESPRGVTGSTLSAPFSGSSEFILSKLPVLNLIARRSNARFRLLEEIFLHQIIRVVHVLRSVGLGHDFTKITSAFFSPEF